jgi:hypothetical protein
MYFEIPLTRGLVTIVDQDVAESLVGRKWYASLQDGHPYAKQSFKISGVTSTRFLHRVIVNAPRGMQVDHINRNTLDNRRENLRICTKREQAFNKRKRCDGLGSSFKGVYKARKSDRWTARIRFDGKAQWLGTYDTEIEAAAAYNVAAKSFHGEFAFLNDLAVAN